MYHNENLLLHDNGTDAEERILVFGTDNELQLLVDADTWFLDGNFKLAPKPFLQLYVIRIEKNSVYVSTLFILMQNKTRSSYESMFSIILNICKDRDLYPDPTFLNMDFEMAVIKAAKNILGEHINIRGCFYHLTQSTHRKIQELGLENRYRNDDEFNLFCCMIDGLAFLPIEFVEDGMSHLKNIAPFGAEDLLLYFDHTYVNGKFRPGKPRKNNIIVQYLEC